MPEDAAVLEAPAESTGAIDTSGSVDTSAADSSQSDTGTSDAIDNADSPQAGETGHLRGAELYRAVKEKLKASGLSPQEQRSIRNAIHIAAKADEFSGGDLTKFESERAAYQQLAFGGEESLTPEQLVETIRGDREQLQGIISDIAAGAPKLLGEMIEDHPEVFKSLAPQAMDKLAELDNERFSNYVAKSAVSYLNSSGLPVEFAVLNEFLPSMPDFPGKNRFVQAIQQVYQTFKGLETIAAKQIAPPEIKTQPQAEQKGQNGQDLEQREFNLRVREWNQTAGTPNVTLRDAEMARTAQTRKVTLTEQEKTEIKAAVREEFEARLAADARYGESMQGYLRNGNKREYEKRAASEGQKLLPSIVARHTNAAIDKRTQAKTAPNGAVKNGATRPVTTATKDSSGNPVQWLSGAPRTVGKQVDYMRTSRQMLERGEAYLKGEKGLFRWKLKTV